MPAGAGRSDIVPRALARPMKFSFAYTGIRARDLDKTVRFFVEGLGMREVGRSHVKETGGTLVNLQSDGREHQLEVNWYPPGSRFDSPFVAGEALDHLYFETERGARLEPAIAHLEAHGGTLRIAPFDESGGRLAYIDSPDGHTVEIFERAA